MTAIEVNGVHKSYGLLRRTRVLRGVDLAVRDGELVGVVGENGSGKSTLLQLIAGNLRPDAGTVTNHGRLGFCPQDPVVDPALTPRQHIRYFQAAYRCGAERAEQLLDVLGASKFADRPLRALSGGTQQKLNLVLALMHGPSVVLLDEPYQGFDWETYLAFWDLAATLRAEGRAIVVITHLAFEQERFDRLLRLVDGRIERASS